MDGTATFQHFHSVCRDEHIRGVFPAATDSGRLHAPSILFCTSDWGLLLP